MASCKNSTSMDAADRDENGAVLLSTGAAYLYYSGARDGAKDDAGGAAYQYHYLGAPTTEAQDDHGAAYAYVFSDALAAAHLYHPGARDGAKNDAGGVAYQHHYSGTPTTEGGDEHGAAYAFSGARTAMPSAVGLFPDARTAAPAKNGAPVIFSGVHVPTAAQTKEDDAACLYLSVHADATSQVKNGAPVIYSGVRASAQDEDAKVYLDFDMTGSAAKNDRRGAAAERGKGNVHFFDLPRVPGFAVAHGDMVPFPTQTTDAAVEKAAAGYYNSGVVAVEALPLASQVFGGKTTSFPAVAVGHDKVAGRLRRELPVLGLSVASLAVAGVAAGELTPAAGFGLFLMLIIGLSTVTIRALRD